MTGLKVPKYIQKAIKRILYWNRVVKNNTRIVEQ